MNMIERGLTVYMVVLDKIFNTIRQTKYIFDELLFILHDDFIIMNEMDMDNY